MRKIIRLIAIGGSIILPVNCVAREASEEKLDVYSLARVILPVEQARNIISYRLDPSPVSGPPAPSVTLLSRPKRIAPGVCRQDTHYFGLPLERGPHPANIASVLVQWTQLAVTDSCDALEPNSRFAQVQPQATDPIEAAQALSWLKRAVEQKGSDRPKFSIKCVSNFNPSGCSAKPEEGLSKLLFKNLFIVSKIDPGAWEYVFSIYGPGGPVWVLSATEMNGPSPKIVMTETIPAPF